MMYQSNKNFSKLQIELLKLYNNEIKDEQLQEIKLLLGKYFAEKATEAMDKTWDDKKLTDQDMIKWANEHNRR